MNLSKIAKKLEEMIKASIKEKGLVDTGKLYNSIKVTVDDKGNYSIKAEDYFVFLNEKYDILKPITESKEFNDYASLIYTEEIEKELSN